MKRTILSLTLLLCTALANAQKPLAYVNGFSGPYNVSRHYIEAIEKSVMQGLIKSNRLEVKDFNSDFEFQQEMKERTEDANISDKEFGFQLLKERNAQWVIDGVVSEFHAERKKTDDGDIYYSAKIDVALALTDVSKGVVTQTKTLSTDQTLTGLFTERGSTIGNSPEDAISNAILLLSYRAKAFAEESFKLKGYILEIAESKKGEAKTVYISMGDIDGVKDGDIFEVFETKIIGGREAQKKIGELKVEEVQGDDLSLCKVKKGGEEIFNKMRTLEEGETLNIRSRMKKRPLGGLGGLL